jgi:hypothetical protein
LRRQEGKAERKAREENKGRAEQKTRYEKARVEKEKLDAAEKAKREARKLSAPTPAEKLEDARRKLNVLKAAEGAKAIEIAGADSGVVIESPLPPEAR